MFNIDKQIADEWDTMRPDSLRITTLHKMKEAGILTFDDFCETGRFISRSGFTAVPNDPPLHPDCTDIVVYMCGFYIQSLKGDKFFINMQETANESDEIERWTFSNDQLEEVEAVLWNSRANKFFNG